MTIGNALRFIEQGLHDAALRRQLNTASDTAQREEILGEEKLMFSAAEFEEAYTHRLTQCQAEEEADQIKEFRMWWSLLTGSACGDACGGCC